MDEYNSEKWHTLEQNREIIFMVLDKLEEDGQLHFQDVFNHLSLFGNNIRKWCNSLTDSQKLDFFINRPAYFTVQENYISRAISSDSLTVYAHKKLCSSVRFILQCFGSVHYLEIKKVVTFVFEDVAYYLLKLSPDEEKELITHIRNVTVDNSGVFTLTTSRKVGSKRLSSEEKCLLSIVYYLSLHGRVHFKKLFEELESSAKKHCDLVSGESSDSTRLSWLKKQEDFFQVDQEDFVSLYDEYASYKCDYQKLRKEQLSLQTEPTCLDSSSHLPETVPIVASEDEVDALGSVPTSSRFLCKKFYISSTYLTSCFNPLHYLEVKECIFFVMEDVTDVLRKLPLSRLQTIFRKVPYTTMDENGFLHFREDCNFDTSFVTKEEMINLFVVYYLGFCGKTHFEKVIQELIKRSPVTVYSRISELTVDDQLKYFKQLPQYFDVSKKGELDVNGSFMLPYLEYKNDPTGNELSHDCAIFSDKCSVSQRMSSSIFFLSTYFELKLTSYTLCVILHVLHDAKAHFFNLSDQAQMTLVKEIFLPFCVDERNIICFAENNAEINFLSGKEMEYLYFACLISGSGRLHYRQAITAYATDTGKIPNHTSSDSLRFKYFKDAEGIFQIGSDGFVVLCPLPILNLGPHYFSEITQTVKSTDFKPPVIRSRCLNSTGSKLSQIQNPSKESFSASQISCNKDNAYKKFYGAVSFLLTYFSPLYYITLKKIISFVLADVGNFLNELPQEKQDSIFKSVPKTSMDENGYLYLKSSSNLHTFVSRNKKQFLFIVGYLVVNGETHYTTILNKLENYQLDVAKLNSSQFYGFLGKHSKYFSRNSSGYVNLSPAFALPDINLKDYINVVPSNPNQNRQLTSVSQKFTSAIHSEFVKSSNMYIKSAQSTNSSVTLSTDGKVQKQESYSIEDAKSREDNILSSSSGTKEQNKLPELKSLLCEKIQDGIFYLLQYFSLNMKTNFLQVLFLVLDLNEIFHYSSIDDKTDILKQILSFFKLKEDGTIISSDSFHESSLEEVEKEELVIAIIVFQQKEMHFLKIFQELSKYNLLLHCDALDTSAKFYYFKERKDIFHIGNDGYVSLLDWPLINLDSSIILQCFSPTDGINLPESEKENQTDITDERCQKDKCSSLIPTTIKSENETKKELCEQILEVNKTELSSVTVTETASIDKKSSENEKVENRNKNLVKEISQFNPNNFVPNKEWFVANNDQFKKGDGFELDSLEEKVHVNKTTTVSKTTVKEISQFNPNNFVPNKEWFVTNNDQLKKEGDDFALDCGKERVHMNKTTTVSVNSNIICKNIAKERETHATISKFNPNIFLPSKEWFSSNCELNNAEDNCIKTKSLRKPLNHAKCAITSSISAKSENLVENVEKSKLIKSDTIEKARSFNLKLDLPRSFNLKLNLPKEMFFTADTSVKKMSVQETLHKQHLLCQNNVEEILAELIQSIVSVLKLYVTKVSWSFVYVVFQVLHTARNKFLLLSEDDQAYVLKKVFEYFFTSDKGSNDLDQSYSGAFKLSEEQEKLLIMCCILTHQKKMNYSELFERYQALKNDFRTSEMTDSDKYNFFVGKKDLFAIESSNVKLHSFSNLKLKSQIQESYLKVWKTINSKQVCDQQLLVKTKRETQDNNLKVSSSMSHLQPTEIDDLGEDGKTEVQENETYSHQLMMELEIVNVCSWPKYRLNIYGELSSSITCLQKNCNVKVDWRLVCLIFQVLNEVKNKFLLLTKDEQTSILKQLFGYFAMKNKLCNFNELYSVNYPLDDEKENFLLMAVLFLIDREEKIHYLELFVRLATMKKNILSYMQTDSDKYKYISSRDNLFSIEDNYVKLLPFPSFDLKRRVRNVDLKIGIIISNFQKRKESVDDERKLLKSDLQASSVKLDVPNLDCKAGKLTECKNSDNANQKIKPNTELKLTKTNTIEEKSDKSCDANMLNNPLCHNSTTESDLQARNSDIATQFANINHINDNLTESKSLGNANQEIMPSTEIKLIKTDNVEEKLDKSCETNLLNKLEMPNSTTQSDLQACSSAKLDISNLNCIADKLTESKSLGNTNLENSTITEFMHIKRNDNVVEDHDNINKKPDKSYDTNSTTQSDLQAYNSSVILDHSSLNYTPDKPLESKSLSNANQVINSNTKSRIAKINNIEEKPEISYCTNQLNTPQALNSAIHSDNFNFCTQKDKVDKSTSSDENKTSGNKIQEFNFLNTLESLMFDTNKVKVNEGILKNKSQTSNSTTELKDAKINHTSKENDAVSDISKLKATKENEVNKRKLKDGEKLDSENIACTSCSIPNFEASKFIDLKECSEISSTNNKKKEGNRSENFSLINGLKINHLGNKSCQLSNDSIKKLDIEIKTLQNCKILVESYIQTCNLEKKEACAVKNKEKVLQKNHQACGSKIDLKATKPINQKEQTGESLLIMNKKMSLENDCSSTSLKSIPPNTSEKQNAQPLSKNSTEAVSDISESAEETKASKSVCLKDKDLDFKNINNKSELTENNSAKITHITKDSEECTTKLCKRLQAGIVYLLKYFRLSPENLLVKVLLHILDPNKVFVELANSEKMDFLQSCFHIFDLDEKGGIFFSSSNSENKMVKLKHEEKTLLSVTCILSRWKELHYRKIFQQLQSQITIPADKEQFNFFRKRSNLFSIANNGYVTLCNFPDIEINSTVLSGFLQPKTVVENTVSDSDVSAKRGVSPVLASPTCKKEKLDCPDNETTEDKIFNLASDESCTVKDYKSENLKRSDACKKVRDAIYFLLDYFKLVSEPHLICVILHALKDIRIFFSNLNISNQDAFIKECLSSCITDSNGQISKTSCLSLQFNLSNTEKDILFLCFILGQVNEMHYIEIFYMYTKYQRVKPASVLSSFDLRKYFSERTNLFSMNSSGYVKLNLCFTVGKNGKILPVNAVFLDSGIMESPLLNSDAFRSIKMTEQSKIHDLQCSGVTKKPVHRNDSVFLDLKHERFKESLAFLNSQCDKVASDCAEAIILHILNDLVELDPGEREKLLSAPTNNCTLASSYGMVSEQEKDLLIIAFALVQLGPVHYNKLFKFLEKMNRDSLKLSTESEQYQYILQHSMHFCISALGIVSFNAISHKGIEKYNHSSPASVEDFKVPLSKSISTENDSSCDELIDSLVGSTVNNLNKSNHTSRKKLRSPTFNLLEIISEENSTDTDSVHPKSKAMSLFEFSNAPKSRLEQQCVYFFTTLLGNVKTANFLKEHLHLASKDIQNHIKDCYEGNIDHFLQIHEMDIPSS